jgi:predicted transcriptional regulator
MSTVELKQRLIDRIALIEEDQILAKVYRLLEWTNANPETVKLTTEMQIALDAGLDDIENGRTIPHEQAKQEIESWLSK